MPVGSSTSMSSSNSRLFGRLETPHSMSRRIQTSAPVPASAPVEKTDGSLMLGGPPSTITENAPESRAGAAQPDDYIARLVKYIPAEIIALYLGIANVIPTTDPSYKL